MKSYRDFKEQLDETHSMSHEFVLNSLADKDINAHVKDGKIVVHKDDAARARAHLKKIGHDHIKVTHVGAGQVAEEVEDLDELTKVALSNYIKKADKDRSKAGIDFGGQGEDKDFDKKFDKEVKRTNKRTAGIKMAVGKLQREDLEEGASDSLKTKRLIRNLEPKLKGDAIEAQYKGNKDAEDKANRRLDFIKRVKDKHHLASCCEETEELDEVLDTPKAVQSYIKKSADKRAKLSQNNSISNPNHSEIRRKLEKSNKGFDKAMEKQYSQMRKEDTSILIQAIDSYLTEARAKKDPMTIYHPSYSSAVAHARDNIEKQGYTVHDDDWWHHVNNGPKKPSEGKTNQLHLPLHKDGKPTKKVAHIQVYNRGNDIKNNHELNMYVN